MVEKMVNTIIFLWKRRRKHQGGEVAVSRAHHLAGAVHLYEVTGSSASWEHCLGQERVWEGERGISPLQGAGLGCSLHRLPACNKTLVQLDNWW